MALMRLRAILASAAAVVAVAGAGDARAVGTRTFELDSIERLSGGDLKGVSVGSDGVVRAGWTLGEAPLPTDAGTTATCAVAMADGSVLIGTGPTSGGKVVRVVNDHGTVFADTKENAVNALAVDARGTVYAATTSNKIYKVTSGHAEVFATLSDVESVFALVADKKGVLYAGTGSDGKVVRIEPNGTTSVYFKAQEPFIVSLAVDDSGIVYAGTSGKGLLYRIASPASASVVYDFGGEDVHGVAIGKNREIWAIANETSGTTTESDSSARHNAGGRSPPGPATIPHAKPGKGSLWRFDAQGRPRAHDASRRLPLSIARAR